VGGGDDIGAKDLDDFQFEGTRSARCEVKTPARGQPNMQLHGWTMAATVWSFMKNDVFKANFSNEEGDLTLRRIVAAVNQEYLAAWLVWSCCRRARWRGHVRRDHLLNISAQKRNAESA
jgi:hypothetical protein